LTTTARYASAIKDDVRGAMVASGIRSETTRERASPDSNQNNGMLKGALAGAAQG
jgi:hypothetical protein